MPDLRKNLQVKQPNVAYEPEGNGWPEPLTDSGPAIRQVINDGKNGESRMNDGLKTSQDKWSTPEGSYAAGSSTEGPVSGQSASGIKTSGYVSDPAGSGAGATQPDTSEPSGRSSFDATSTSQQRLGHHKTLGE